MRSVWLLRLSIIVAAGIASRLVHTGWLVLDKYIGDALYAAMAYALLRLVWIAARPPLLAVWAMAVMTAVELFQLTHIAAHMLSSPHLLVRLCARLMGTQFSALDLLVYAIAIAALAAFDIASAK